MIKPNFIHVFPYSRRANTPAAEMEGQVKESVKKERVDALTKLSDELHTDYCRRYEGTEQAVLYESTLKGGKMYGYTSNYIRVEKPYDKQSIGKIIKLNL